MPKKINELLDAITQYCLGKDTSKFYLDFRGERMQPLIHDQR